MESIRFSDAEIEVLQLSQLRVLLDYYEVKYPKKASKKKLTEILKKYYNPDNGDVFINDAGLPEELQMSVRVRRIKESSNHVR